ncbi:MAG: Ig-like domain-containing protein [Candidatus Coatesbacteria bacterium]|nr:MAG: Ig-like domain-containing protein [Candidatus Coatesbacteria bacterium]
MKRFACIIALSSAAAVLVAGCAKVGVPPGAEELEDDRPPSLTKVKAVDANHVEVYFDEAIDVIAALDEKHYRITTDDERELPVKAVVSAGRADGVILVTDAQEPGARYELVVRNVRDEAGGNPIETNNRKAFRGSSRADKKEPAVAGSYPPDGAEGVGLRPEIRVMFNDAMNAATLRDVITLTDDLGREIQGEASTGVMSVAFRPAEKLDYETVYTVTVANTCADVAGNLLFLPARIAFKTASDTLEGTVVGRVVAAEEGLDVSGAEVLLALAPSTESESAFVAAFAVTNDEGYFRLDGIAPNTEASPTYYLLVHKLQPGGEELVGVYDPDRDGDANALPEFVGGERLDNVTVYLGKPDREGPVVSDIVFSPNPTDGQTGAYIAARVSDPEGRAEITAAEFFVDAPASDGTGISLAPVGAVWGTAPAAEVERYITDLKAGGAGKKGEHIIYVHARDSAGNWGDFYEYAVNVTGKPKGARKLSGTVYFELDVVEKAIVAAYADGADYPAAVVVTDEDGEYEIEGLPPGRYRVRAFLDEDEDAGWGRAEPAGAAEETVELRFYDAGGVDITLTYVPAITAANARIQHYLDPAGEGEKVVLRITARVRDPDMDLDEVLAVLPDGTELELLDIGLGPDEAPDDNIFTAEVTYRGAEVAATPVGEVVVYARDRFGNETSAGPDRHPGLYARLLPVPANVRAEDRPDGIHVAWESVAGADGGYVVFLIPLDRLDRFKGPDTSEVWSNHRAPTFEPKVTIPYESVEDWWAYPVGARFVLMVTAGAGDARTVGDSDKSIYVLPYTKSAVKPRLPGEVGG